MLTPVLEMMGLVEVLGPDGVRLAAEVVGASALGGAVVFTLVHAVVACFGILPASLLGVLAGATYGFALGSPLAVVATMSGAAGAFALSRSVLRPRVERYLARRPFLADVDRLIAANGWQVVFLLRLSPILPFTVSSYALGLSALGFRNYLVGTTGALPGLLACVWIGDQASAAALEFSTGRPVLQRLLLLAGSLATIWLLLCVSKMVRAAALRTRLAHPA